MNREKKKNGDDKTSINQLLTAIFIYSSIFFAAGLTYDIVLYTLDAKWFLLAANTAALLMMGAVFAVYAAGKTDSDIALFANMLIVTLNLAVSIVYEGIVNRPDASFTVLLGMCICALPIIMASLTGIRAAPVIITLIIICSYSVSAILIGDEKLFLCMPILMLIYTGAPIALKSIVILSRRLEREKIEITREKSEFLRIMNIEAERFKLIGAHGTREAAKLMDELDAREAAKLMDELDAKVRDTLVSQVKHVIHSEEMVREAIRKRHPELTDAEAEVALLIVKDKTVSEICEIRHVSPSTVTSIRSRLRKKAGLRPEESLKSHLKSVVNAYITAG